MAPTLKNAARDRLDAGELALGVGIRQGRTVDTAAIMKACGYDWLFLDLEHNSMDLDTAVQISVAALGAGIAPIARVPAGQHWLATRILDGGGLGIVMPHVDTVEEAREIADRLRYPPRGHRSIAGGLPHFGYAPVSTADATAAIDAATLVVVMLETPKAIENAAAIAAVPGIELVADRHQRFVDRNGHPRPVRGSAHRRGLSLGRRGLQGARQIRRHWRHLRRRAAAPLYRDGCAAGDRRQRSRLYDERRHRPCGDAARLSLAPKRRRRVGPVVLFFTGNLQAFLNRRLAGKPRRGAGIGGGELAVLQELGGVTLVELAEG